MLLPLNRASLCWSFCTAYCASVQHLERMWNRRDLRADGMTRHGSTGRDMTRATRAYTGQDGLQEQLGARMSLERLVRCLEEFWDVLSLVQRKHFATFQRWLKGLYFTRWTVQFLSQLAQYLHKNPGHFRQIVFDPRASFLAGGPLSSPRPWPSYEDVAKETGIWTHDMTWYHMITFIETHEAQKNSELMWIMSILKLLKQVKQKR